MYYYCMGIRLDQNYQERACKVRDSCHFYSEGRLSEFLSKPDTYAELDTYNNEICLHERQCEKNSNLNSRERSGSSDFPIFGE